MSFDPILALIAIIFGILVIVFEELLSWIVGIFFILVGLWLLYDYFTKKNQPANRPQQGQEYRPPAEERK
jgi:predicted membrane protein